MLSSRTLVTPLIFGIFLLGCGPGEEGNPPPKEEDPGSTTVFVGASETPQPGADEALPDDGTAPVPDLRVRVAMVIDISQSMNVTDPVHPIDGSTARQRAALELVNHLNGGDAAFAFVPFNGKYPVVNAGMSDGFTDAGSVIEPALATLSQGSGTSDYQTALTTVRDLIAADMAASTDEDLARSIYTVIFLADGRPSLICAPGCNGKVICDEPREQWSDGSACGDGECGVPSDEEWPLLEQCGAYNTPQSLQQLAVEITSLSDTAAVHLNMVYLSTPFTPAWVNESNSDFLSGMAAAGGGTYLEVFDPSQLSFVDPFGLGL